MCVCVCVSACAPGPSPEPMYYKSSHCKIIFGFSRPASNYHWPFLHHSHFPFTPTTQLLHSPHTLSLPLVALTLTCERTHTSKQRFFGLNKLFLLGYLQGGIETKGLKGGSDLALFVLLNDHLNQAHLI